MAASFVFHVRIVIFQPVDAPHDFRKVHSLGGDAGRLEKFFAIAHGVECRRTGTDAAHAQIAAVH